MNPQTNTAPQEQPEAPASFAAILPLLLFLLIFIGTGVSLSLTGVDMAFYQLSATVAILPAIALALMQGRARLAKKITIFLTGVGEINIITMCMIYLLAGGFAATATAIGSVDATVNFGLSLVPPAFILPGLFLIGAFVSTAMGTSMGTVAAITPIALGVAAQTSIEVPVLMGVVLGGAMFGDNLSMISDTTIAATRGAGAEMRDKFKMNGLIALTAAIISCVIFTLVGSSGELTGTFEYDLIKVVPYIFVLLFALTGCNVFVLLLAGIGVAGAVGIFTNSITIIEFAQAVGSGMSGMFEICIIALLLRGVSGVVRDLGGIDWMVAKMVSKVKTRKGAEYMIAAMVSIFDAALANNTIAIILAAPLTRQMAAEHNISPKRVASLLDIFACVVQGIIPHGGQILLAVTLTGLSPFDLIIHNYYVYILAIVTIITIQFGLMKTREEKEGIPLYDENMEPVAKKGNL